jgi:hypothetical protein
MTKINLDKIDLDRAELVEAVAQGVKEAFAEALTGGPLDPDPDWRLYDAVKRGVVEAIWNVATNGTGHPSADFYEAISEGVSRATFRLKDGEGSA